MLLVVDENLQEKKSCGIKTGNSTKQPKSRTGKQGQKHKQKCEHTVQLNVSVIKSSGEPKREQKQHLKEQYPN